MLSTDPYQQDEKVPLSKGLALVLAERGVFEFY
jgi:hypothetical protein